MTKAVFLTTNTNDCVNHIDAWRYSFGEPVGTITFDASHGIAERLDASLISRISKLTPDIIFYIGAFRGVGVPKLPTFSAINEIAPLINIVSDAADPPWHQVLRLCAARGCFSAQVSIDGFMQKGLIDIGVLTPVDPRKFSKSAARDILCGFSGGIPAAPSNHPRRLVLSPLIDSGIVKLRRRTKATYDEHVMFMLSCRMIINSSFTGSAKTHHMKGRVLESGHAGCCLLESEGSPIGDWFPDDCYFLYRDPPEAAHLIKTLTDDQIEHAAERLQEEVRARFMPAMIYGEILKNVGLSVS